MNGGAMLCHRLGVMLLLYSVVWIGTAQAQNQATITMLQDIRFGAFALTGNSGTVTVSSDGTRTATGDILLLGNDYNAGLFRVEAPIGTNLNLNIALSFTLTGNNGGQLSGEMKETYPLFPFNTLAPYHDFSFGATLIAGSSGETPSGAYNGSFEIVVNYD